MSDHVTEEFLIALQVLCRKHGASLFFGDRWSELWIHGEFRGCIQDSEGSVGDAFEIIEEPKS